MSQVSVTRALVVPMDNMDGEVRFKHLRPYFYDFESLEYSVYNKGGVTLAYRYLTSEELIDLVYTDEIPIIVVGFAACSIEDNFDRKLGRSIALERLRESEVLIAGDDYIGRIMRAKEPEQVQDILEQPMFVQGLRIELCM